MNLLEEGKKRYPIGTKFISPHNGREYTVTLTKNFEEVYYTTNDDGAYLLCTVTSSGTRDYLYYNGLWAKIIELPFTPEENYRYLEELLKRLNIK